MEIAVLIELRHVWIVKMQTVLSLEIFVSNQLPLGTHNL